MAASLRGHLEVVRYLVGECNASVGVARADGTTASMLAYQQGYLEVVRYLIGECNASADLALKLTLRCKLHITASRSINAVETAA